MNLLLRLRNAPLFSISARAFLNGVGVRGVVSSMERLILGVLKDVFFSLQKTMHAHVMHMSNIRLRFRVDIAYG